MSVHATRATRTAACRPIACRQQSLEVLRIASATSPSNTPPHKITTLVKTLSQPQQSGGDAHLVVVKLRKHLVQTAVSVTRHLKEIEIVLFEAQYHPVGPHTCESLSRRPRRSAHDEPTAIGRARKDVVPNMCVFVYGSHVDTPQFLQYTCPSQPRTAQMRVKTDGNQSVKP